MFETGELNVEWKSHRQIPIFSLMYHCKYVNQTIICLRVQTHEIKLQEK